jgi:hypothetical protein
MALPAFLGKIVGWLRAGYPDGMPERDYIPLMALLGKHLASDEVTLIAGELDISAPVTAEEIKKAIGAITRAPVNDADTARSARTSQQAAGRWHRQTGADRRPGGRAGSAQNDHTPAALGAWPTTEPRVGALVRRRTGSSPPARRCQGPRPLGTHPAPGGADRPGMFILIQAGAFGL